MIQKARLAAGISDPALIAAVIVADKLTAIESRLDKIENRLIELRND